VEVCLGAGDEKGDALVAALMACIFYAGFCC
jgi:hypothetical protein